ncbi:MAG: zinc-binding dehydrogenase [Actinomycetaceae bacterium]|nr:zinc-binding dehydrogenase [Actinomycetaceae bacterium]
MRAIVPSAAVATDAPGVTETAQPTAVPAAAPGPAPASTQSPATAVPAGTQAPATAVPAGTGTAQGETTPVAAAVTRPLSDLLTEVEIPTPVPAPHEVRIRIRSAGVNAADLLQARGHYPPPRGVTDVLGLECAGTIDLVGEDVPTLVAQGGTLTDLSVGAPVCALLAGGGYAQFVCVDARHVLPLPPKPEAEQTRGTETANGGGVSSHRGEDGTAPTQADFDRAAAVVEACAASWMMLADVGGLAPSADRGEANTPTTDSANSAYPIDASPTSSPRGSDVAATAGDAPTGRTVLVHGASGAVGSIAVQLASAWGHRVLATAGDADRARKVDSLGAARCFDYHEDWVCPVRSEGGADFTLDVIGAAGLGSNVKALARGGTLAVLGMIKGAKAELNLGLLIGKNATIAARTVRSQSAQEKAQLCRHLAEDVWPLFAQGRVREVIGKVGSLRNAHDSVGVDRRGDGSRPFGKTVLREDWEPEG